MELEAEVIYDELLRRFGASLVGPSRGLRYKRPIPFASCGALSNYVLICRAGDVLTVNPGQHHAIRRNLLVCADDGTGISLPKTAEVIIVPGISTEDLLCAVMEIYDKFEEWERDVQDMIVARDGYAKLAERAEAVFPEPFAFIDKDNRYIAYSSRYRKEFVIPNNALENSAVPWVFVNDASMRLQWNKITGSDEPFALSFSESSCDIVGKGIFVKGAFVGHVGIVVDDAGRRPYCMAMLDKLHRMVDKMKELVPFAANVGSEAGGVGALIKRTLECNEPAREEWAVAAAGREWRAGGRYIAVRMRLHPFYGAGSSFHQDMFSGSLAEALRCFDERGRSGAESESEYGMVLNLAELGIDCSSADRMLTDLVKENLLVCGRSRLFSEMGDASCAFRQAKVALDQGLESGNTGWSFRFEDQVLPYLVSRSRGELDVRSACDEKALALRDYDAIHGSEYCRTLRTFLANSCNASRTATDLHIQRTTLAYRMGRIRQIADVDLGSEPELLHLLLSFALLDQVEGDMLPLGKRLGSTR